MTYGLNPGLFVEDGAAVHAARAAAARRAARLSRWLKLDDKHRLQAVERALGAPANDLIDELPVAL